MKLKSILKSQNVTFLPIVQPRSNRSMRRIAAWCNGFLMVLWLPVLMIGLTCLYLQYPYYEGECGLLSWGIGFIGSILVHELAHAAAGMAYGASVEELGLILMLKKLIGGAYVSMDVGSVKVKLRRVQISAAGAEMNMLLAGVCLILASLYQANSALWTTVGLNNLLLGVSNLLFVSGLDGMAILEELLNIGDIGESIEQMKGCDIICQWKRSGRSGPVMMAYAVIHLLMKVTPPLLIAWDILEVIFVCLV